MRRPDTLAALSRFAVASGDPYLAIPVYPFAEGEMAARLEAIILAKPRHRLVFATMPFVPARLLERLAEEPNVHVARRLAANPGASGTVLRRLRDRWPDDKQVGKSLAARVRVAGNGAARARDLDPSTLCGRRALARSTGLQPDLAARFAADPDSWVRRWLGRNPVVPVAILECLAGDRDLQVRRAVGRNPACPPHLQGELARDPAAWVRAAIAFRDDMPPDLIAVLAGDDDPDVLSGLGRNPVAPAELLVRIAGSSDPDLRRSVILNRAAPASVLETLLDDPYPLNRVLLAIHPRLREDAAWSLVADPEPQVRYRAMARAVKHCMTADRASSASTAVVPAKAGTHPSTGAAADKWGLAYAGMTVR